MVQPIVVYGLKKKGLHLDSQFVSGEKTFN
jgi:hypothetical protein